MVLKRRSFPISRRVLFLLFPLLLIASRFVPPAAHLEDRFLHGIFRPILSVTKTAEKKISEIVHHYLFLAGAAQENEVIKKELSGLKGRVAQLESQKAEWDRLTEYFHFSEKVSYKIEVARILAFDPLSASQSLLIDKGSEEGIQKGQAVIVPAGVVGVVAKVLPHESQVLLITDFNAAVDGEVQPSRARGILHGKQVNLGLERNYWMTQMDYLGTSSEVHEQDTVVTSGLDQAFPPGLAIGKVHKVVRDSQGLFLSAEVLPGVEFTKLREVMVIVGRS